MGGGVGSPPKSKVAPGGERGAGFSTGGRLDSKMRSLSCLREKQQ